MGISNLFFLTFLAGTYYIVIWTLFLTGIGQILCLKTSSRMRRTRVGGPSVDWWNLDNIRKARWWGSNIFWVSPPVWEVDPFLTIFFSNGLKPLSQERLGTWGDFWSHKKKLSGQSNSCLHLRWEILGVGTPRKTKKCSLKINGWKMYFLNPFGFFVHLEHQGIARYYPVNFMIFQRNKVHNFETWQ